MFECEKQELLRTFGLVFLSISMILHAACCVASLALEQTFTPPPTTLLGIPAPLPRAP